MSTTYILAGGDDRDYDEFGKRLADIVTHQKQNPKILSCFFSSDPTQWMGKSVVWAAWVKTYFGSDTEHRVASVEDFVNEVEWADVVYFHGGTTLLLVETMAQFEPSESLFENKVIIGSSAGSNYLSKTYYSPKRDEVGNGSGILDVATIVHYGANDDGEVSLSKEGWQRVVSRTQEAIAEGEKILLLPEGSFVTIIK